MTMIMAMHRSCVCLLAILVFLTCFSWSHSSLELGRASLSSDDSVPLRRVVAEVPPSPPLPDVNITENNGSFPLAAQRTHRKDPLNDFKRYTGGWNISEEHYWASVGFSAVPLWVIALVWFVGFGLILLCIGFYFCCCRRRSYSYSRVAYALSLILLILFTCAAIIGCAVLYTGQGKFHSSTVNTLDYIVGQANLTVDNLKNFSSSLAAAKNIAVDNVFLPFDLRAKIDTVDSKLNSSAVDLGDKTLENSKKIRDLLDSVGLSLVIIAAVMLLLAFLGFIFSIFGLQFLVSILVIIGWILVTGTFILCGVFLLLHNVVGDTCDAMDDWVQHPQLHTALDDILPCVDVATANESYYESRNVTFQLVNVVNQVIVNVSNRNFPAALAPVYYNQSGPLVPTLCNPYTSDLNNATCQTGQVDFSNATQVWKGYVCETTVVSGNPICRTTGRLTPAFYGQMAAAVNVSQGLYYYVPFLTELEDCTFVRQTFTTINAEHCPGLEKYSKYTYIGLVMVSGAVMLSLIFWVIYARERRHRKYNKQFLMQSSQSNMPMQEKMP